MFLRFAIRDQVDRSNNYHLARRSGDLHTYIANDWGDINKIEQSCIAPKILQLKLNAQVILLKNMDDTLVNGSMGVVVGFVGDNSHGTNSTAGSEPVPTRVVVPLVRFSNGREIIVKREEWKIEMPGMCSCLFKLPKVFFSCLLL